MEKQVLQEFCNPYFHSLVFFFDIVQPQPVETQVKWVLVLQKEGVIGLTPVKNSFFRRVGRG